MKNWPYNMVKKEFIMRKMLSLVFVLTLIINLSASFCDAGPKPQLNISIENVEGSSCIVGLLTKNPENDLWIGWYNVLGGDYVDDRIYEFDDGVIAKVSEITAGELSGVIVSNVESHSARVNYNYGVPSRFKIIVVQENGESFISNVVETKAFDSKVEFDLDTGVAKEESIYFLALLMFVKTFLITLLIEGIVLWSFGFLTRKNLEVLLKVNLITQVSLTFSMVFAMNLMGILLAVLVFIIGEPIIFIVEAKLFMSNLMGHSKKRRLVFALTANLASLLLGTFLVFSL